MTAYLQFMYCSPVRLIALTTYSLFYISRVKDKLWITFWTTFSCDCILKSDSNPILTSDSIELWTFHKRNVWCFALLQTELKHPFIQIMICERHCYNGGDWRSQQDGRPKPLLLTSRASESGVRSVENIPSRLVLAASNSSSSAYPSAADTDSAEDCMHKFGAKVEHGRPERRWWRRMTAKTDGTGGGRGIAVGSREGEEG